MRGIVGRIGGMGAWTPRLLALVLVFRLLVPAGYMIDPAQAGLVFCSPPATAAAQAGGHGGADGHPGAPAPGKADERPCAYAALAAPPLPTVPPAFLPPTPDEASPPVLPAAQGRSRPGLAAPPPHATGPPMPV